MLFVYNQQGILVPKKELNNIKLLNNEFKNINESLINVPLYKDEALNETQFYNAKKDIIVLKERELDLILNKIKNEKFGSKEVNFTINLIQYPYSERNTNTISAFVFTFNNSSFKNFIKNEFIGTVFITIADKFINYITGEGLSFDLSLNAILTNTAQFLYNFFTNKPIDTLQINYVYMYNITRLLSERSLYFNYYPELSLKESLNMIGAKEFRFEIVAKLKSKDRKINIL